MSEKQKMISGDYYQPWDEELVNERQYAKQLCYQYNLLAPDESAQQQDILKRLLGTTTNSNINPAFYCDYGYNIRVGINFYTNHHCTILDAAPVTIGDDVLFGPNVTLSTSGHPLNAAQRKAGIEYAKPITIGSNVWLGASVTVTPGVTIGDNAVIGAGSVVTRDIPANCVAVGVPCRVQKSLGYG